MTVFIPVNAPAYQQENIPAGSDVLGANIGSVPKVPNALASAQLDITILVDPVKIKAYKESLADQMNAQSGTGKTIKDLSERIGEVTIETSAQGASILTVPIIDPLWYIPMSGFIQVDADGFLWPPIDINFPSGTDCIWRLCQYHAIWDAEIGTDPNLTLTFEDRIVSLMREMSPVNGIAQGQPNQTLAGFMQQLVDSANKVLGPSPKIRFRPMVDPQDPNYVLLINDVPSSAQGPLRKQNPTKTLRGLTPAMQAQILAVQNAVNLFLGEAANTVIPGAVSLSDAETNASALWSWLLNNDPVPGSGVLPAAVPSPPPTGPPQG